MGKEIGKGYSRDATNSERLGLDLDESKASSLFLILKYFIMDYENRLHAIQSDKDLSEENRATALEIEQSLMMDADILYKETGQVVMELEKPKPLIFTKPQWKQD